MSRSATPGLAFILLTVLLDVIGIGMIIPVLPQLVSTLTGDGLDQAAVAGGWLTFIYGGMQLLFAPVIGNLSDRFGRRPLLLISVFTFGIDNLICALAPSLGWLFLGRCLAGISGSSFSTANAYIADITPKENRARRFGLIGVMFGVGFVVGPALGGVMGELGPRAPFFAAAGLSLANFLFGYFFLTESLPADRRRPFSFRRANPLGAIRTMARYKGLGGLAVVMVLARIAHDSMPTVWSFYGKLKFGWSEHQIGLSLAAVGVAMVVVMGGIIGPLVKRFGEKRASLTGLAFAAVGFIGFAFAPRAAVLLPFIAPFAMIGLIEPPLKAIASSRVPPDAQGELQGAISALQSFTMALAPIPMTHLFSIFSAPDAPVHFPGAPFLLAAFLMMAGFLLLSRRRI